MRFLDTNIILRYITNDIPAESLKCERLLKNAAKSKEALFTNAMVIAEVVWVLFSAYRFPKNNVISGVQKILNSPNIYLDDKDLLLSALYIFENNNIDFIDAYNAAVMEYKEIEIIYSYDKHYDQIKKIKRIEP
ncbi:MAG: PIN domain-containing protein [Candidatus Omnitrophota bacterium]